MEGGLIFPVPGVTRDGQVDIDLSQFVFVDGLDEAGNVTGCCTCASSAVYTAVTYGQRASHIVRNVCIHGFVLHNIVANLLSDMGVAAYPQRLLVRDGEVHMVHMAPPAPRMQHAAIVVGGGALAAVIGLWAWLFPNPNTAESGG